MNRGLFHHEPANAHTDAHSNAHSNAHTQKPADFYPNIHANTDANPYAKLNLAYVKSGRHLQPS